MSLEEKLEKDPSFKAYQEVQKIADPVCLKYFKKWYEIIALEQSAVNVSVHTTLNNTDRKQIKDEGLKISKFESCPDNSHEFFVYVERPFYNGSKLSSEIGENTYVNLHTQKSISFTKGMVIKRHLITKEEDKTEESKEDEEACNDDNMLEDDKADEKKKKR